MGDLCFSDHLKITRFDWNFVKYYINENSNSPIHLFFFFLIYADKKSSRKFKKIIHEICKMLICFWIVMSSFGERKVSMNKWEKFFENSAIRHVGLD